MFGRVCAHAFDTGAHTLNTFKRATVRNLPFCLFIPGILINSLIKLKCFSYTSVRDLSSFTQCVHSSYPSLPPRTNFHATRMQASLHAHVSVCGDCAFIFLLVFFVFVFLNFAFYALHIYYYYYYVWAALRLRSTLPSIVASRPSAGLKRVVNSFVLLRPCRHWVDGL